MSNLELALRIKADLGNAQQALASLNAHVKQLSGMSQGLSGQAGKAASALSRMGDSAAKSVGGYTKAAQGVRSISEQLDRLQGYGLAWLGLSGLSSQVGKLVSLADQYGQMASRIRMVTADTAEYEMVQQRLIDTADKTYRPLAEAQEVYIRTADALKSLGYNTEQALDVSDSLSYLFVTNAASGERATHAITSFSKAIATGKIEVDTWQSILAAVPSIVNAIATASGKTTEEIRKLGATGKLAVADLTEGLRKSRDAHEQLAKDMPVTVRDAFTSLTNAIQVYVGEANHGFISTGTLVTALELLKKNLDLVAATLKGAGLIVLMKFVLQMGQASIAAIRLAIDEKKAALAALEEAKAELAAAEASVVHAKAATGLGTAVAGVAAAESRAAAAATALAAAQARAAAATGAWAVAGRGLMTFLGGPLGLALVGLTAVASIVALLRDNTKSTSPEIEALASSLLSAGKSAKEAGEELQKLTQTQQAALGVKLREDAEAARDAYMEAHREMLRMFSKAMPGTFDHSEEARTLKSELQSLSAEAVRLMQMGGSFDPLTEGIRKSAAITERQKTALIKLLAEMESAHKKGEDISGMLRRLENAATGAASGIAALGNAGVGLEGLDRMIGSLTDQLFLAKEGNTHVARTLLAASKELDKSPNADSEAARKQMQKLLVLAKEQDALAARQKSRSGRTKADPFLQQQENLTRQLVEANLKLADAQSGVEEGTRAQQNALGLWLSTAREAGGLTDAQRDALLRQARAVDEAAASVKHLVEARERLKEIGKAGDELGIELLKLQGNSPEADRRELEARYRELREKLEVEIKRSGSGDALKVKTQLEAVIQLTLEKQEVDRAETEIQSIQTRLQQAQSTVNTNREVGLITDVEAAEQLLSINHRHAAELKARIPLLERLAQLEGATGEAAKAALADAENQVKLLEATTTKFEATLKQGVSEGLSNAIEGLADGTMNLKEAVHELSTTIFESLLKMYSESLMQRVTGPDGPLAGFFRMANEGTGGKGGFLGAIFGKGVDSSGTTAKLATDTAASVTGSATDAAAGSQQMLAAQTQLTAAQTMMTALAQLQAALGQSATQQMTAASTQASAASVQTSAASVETNTAMTNITAASTQTTAASTQVSAASAMQSAAAGSGAGGGISELVGKLFSGLSSGIGSLFSGIGGLFGGLFAEGGYTGSGSKYQPAGIVHAGEFVTNAKRLREPGTRTFLEMMNRHGLAHAAHAFNLPGFADGGFVPAPPQISSPLQSLAANFRAETPSVTASTQLDNRFAFNLIDSPERIASALRTPAGEKAFTVMLSRNPQKFRMALGL